MLLPGSPCCLTFVFPWPPTNPPCCSQVPLSPEQSPQQLALWLPLPLLGSFSKSLWGPLCSLFFSACAASWWVWLPHPMGVTSQWVQPPGGYSLLECHGEPGPKERSVSFPLCAPHPHLYPCLQLFFWFWSRGLRE